MRIERIMYMSAQQSTTCCTLSPLADLPSYGRPAINQVIVNVDNLQVAPCELFTSVASCGRYRVIIERTS